MRPPRTGSFISLLIVFGIGTLYVKKYSLHHAGVNVEIRGAQRPLRFAFLISGSLRSLVRADVRALQRRALFDPLVGGHVDIFLNLDLDEVTQNSTLLHILKEELSPASVIVKSYQCLEDCEKPGCLSNAITTSRTYEQLQRVREAMTSIQTVEETSGELYDFVIRVRPDLEFYESLPPLECWEAIPDFVIWDLDARFSDKGDHLLKKHIVPSIDVKFLGDWFTIVPRKMASEFFSDPIQQMIGCIPLEPTMPHPFSCGTNNEFWHFPECRFLVAAQKLHAHIGKLMLERQEGPQYIPHTIIRCENLECSSVHRMNGPRFCEDRICKYPAVQDVPIGKNFTMRRDCFHGFSKKAM